MSGRDFKGLAVLAGVGAALCAMNVSTKTVLPAGAPALSPPDGRETVASRLKQVGTPTRARWQPFFAAKNLVYPPQKLLFVGLKAEKQLQIYAPDASEKWQLVRSMPILKASGVGGPKLRLGDGQVPEGAYIIESLNPNSRFHLSLRISYPSVEDRLQAHRDGRDKLGGDIMIHGSNQSVGCLAMGDEGAEDLFVLAADTLNTPIQVLLCPLDFRRADVAPDAHRAAWVEARYNRLREALQQLPLD